MRDRVKRPERVRVVASASTVETGTPVYYSKLSNGSIWRHEARGGVVLKGSHVWPIDVPISLKWRRVAAEGAAS